ncbi:hypothetical protein BCR42DRAFT_428516 [Absidia repens]|uniref:Zn(2)-C6 fungal-type domain-containing protein n=1 Tax=Absidia repens TaxID=90262 RepID=A0A1X2HYH5_9FUNG|nr:hypothetical protein BCR42DRAFT_428516 [Absidia repens]
MATDEHQVAGNEPRKKRAKIVSACGECRRRKTKCNGELPCRSCHKADVPCVYPAVSHAEDKRNHLSKAALEAIEDRLKAIEDMLHTILQSQSFVAELPTAAQHANTSSSSSSATYAAFPPPPQSATTPLSHPPLSGHSPQHQYQKSATTTTTSASISSPDVRLPSIHDLSSRSVYSSPPSSSSSHKVKQEEPDTTDLPPPLGYPSYTGRIDIPSGNSLSTIKKRKRSS